SKPNGVMKPLHDEKRGQNGADARYAEADQSPEARHGTEYGHGRQPRAPALGDGRKWSAACVAYAGPTASSTGTGVHQCAYLGIRPVIVRKKRSCSFRVTGPGSPEPIFRRSISRTDDTC